MSKLVKYEGSGEWSALYVDGVLDRAGDHYLINERIEELAGVEVWSSDDFLRGGEYHEDVAPTLSELHQYRHLRETAEADAAKLREQAADLLEQANRLDPS